MSITRREAEIALECLVEVHTDAVDNLGHIVSVLDTKAKVQWFGIDAPPASTVPLADIQLTREARIVVDKYATEATAKALAGFSIEDLQAEIDRRLAEQLKPLIIHEDSIECPHCGATDALTEVDKAERWNNDGDVRVEDGKITEMYWGTGDGDYHHSHYQCAACDRPVRIDQDLTEVSQDWS
ncbi:hypothetical protein [Actinoplanes sp. NPDC026670]|uniref:hypothetical protein n=1 Tax=Actinoplanes sp. NPDC026670 TaxID=3154700 RepID=UPI0033F2F764